VYTLVSASVLALDLVRHPSGGAVADVLDTALALGPWTSVGTDTVDLDRAAARRRLLAQAERAPRLDQALRAVTASLGTGAEGRDVGVLQSALVGRLDDLVALVGTELGDRRGLSGEVVDLIVDRAVAAWTQACPQVRPADLALLAAPWRSLVGELPPLPPHEGAVGELLDLLEALAGARRPVWAALDAAHEDEHRGLRWSELMHQGSRAAVDVDRTLAVARWQLSGVRALSRSGAAAWPGAVMSVVGAVQALALRDVLPTVVADGLLAPCRAVGLAPRS